MQRGRVHTFILAITLGLLSGIVAGCEDRVAGLEGVDFDKELTLKEDGLVYRKGEDKLYTGKAYCQQFDGQSRILGWDLHWHGEFKDGKKHGIFLFPASRKPFFLWGGNDFIQVQFRDGIEVHSEN